MGRKSKELNVIFYLRNNSFLPIIVAQPSWHFTSSFFRYQNPAKELCP